MNPVRARQHFLHSGWTARCPRPAPGAPAGVEDRTLQATVPGQIHTDLQRDQIIPDPSVGDGERAQAWVGRSVWEYRTVFEYSSDDRTPGSVDLVAAGIDTFARVTLNGTLLGQTRDQHLTYRWDVSRTLRDGANELIVELGSAFDAAAALEEQVGPLPRPYPDPYPFVRKTACNFGWDWGPRLTTVGIWRPIYLHRWSRARIQGVRPHVRIRQDEHERLEACVDVDVDLVMATDPAPAGVEVDVELLDPSGNRVAHGLVAAPEAGNPSAPVSLRVAQPQLWWPAGLGEQPLYELRTVLSVAGHIVDEDSRHIGLRSVRVDQSPDDGGNRFALMVNDRRVRVRGYNWIPDLPFPNDVTADRLDQRLDQALEGGANLLRVWGGGHFADEQFLSGCDRRGLLVWHDFLFACAAYSEDPTTLADVSSEAEQAISRMAAHPSLVLWCGGNECVWGWHDWGWQTELGEAPWGGRVYTDVLPEIVQRLDPTRPYLPNSPWSGSLRRHPEDEEIGVVHIWTAWNERDYTTYRDWDPRFVAEMGWCSPATHTTLRRAIPEGDLLPSNPAVQHHMRAEDGMAKLARGLARHFDDPDDADTWLYLAQVTQARAMTAGTEWLRSRPTCDGVIVWQLNDCWPALSWSVVDVDGLRKPAWYALRRSFVARLLTLQPSRPGDRWGEDGLALVAVNDELDHWDVAVTIRRMHVDGSQLASAPIRLAAAPDSAARTRVPEPVGAVEDPLREFLVADAAGSRTTWFYRPDRELDLPRPQMRTEVSRQDGVVLVRVTAESLLRDLVLHPDRAAAMLGVDPATVQVDDMLNTVLPGETVEYRVTGLADVPLARARQVLGSPPVMRAIGDDAGQTTTLAHSQGLPTMPGNDRNHARRTPTPPGDRTLPKS